MSKSDLGAGDRMCPPAGSEYEGSRSDRTQAVRVWVLGGFEVSVGPRAIRRDAWHLKKAAALVKLLALAPGHRLHREQVMNLLWPDSGRKAASNSLRKTLHAARRTLDPNTGSDYLASEDESLVLCPRGEIWVDVEVFEEAVATARRAREPATYRAAIGLYSGELLPEDRYEEWAAGRREELQQSFLSLLSGLAGIYEQRGEYELGIEALRKVVADEPTNQEAHAGLMRLHALSGRRDQALAQYERLEIVLSSELGAEPNTLTRALREEISAGRFSPLEQSVGPPIGESSDSTRHNLPAARTSFVGREREMLEVKRTLVMTRLLTLTGAGGSGKTRLALEVARDLVASYPDGVWLVELAPLSEDELVSQAVASTLGIPERPDQPLKVTLVDALHAKQSLLVLDNCEHLVEAVAYFVDALLDGCPRLRILATSRERLDVPGETIYPVSPLSVPNLQRSPTVEELERYEAARLFAERAAEKRRGFALAPANAGTVAEICRRLDGLPLAMELAAARVGTLSVDQISERLGDSLGLLIGGARTAAPRQRTLKGTLDWSLNLLSEPERKVLPRLSVFAGGWRLKAAEVVASDDEIEEEKVLDILAELVEKSLVVAETPAEGEVRYRMLEPVRQYALEKLEGSKEAEVVRRQHFAYFLEFSEEIASKLTGPQQGPYFRQLEAEHNNLRSALSWALEREEAELELRLSGVLWWFWLWRGHYAEGRTWLEAGLTKDKAMTASVQAKALYGLGRIATMQGDYELALASQEESISLYRAAGNESGIARCLGDLGWLAWLRSEFLQATALLQESLARLREFGDEGDIAFVLTRLAHVAFSDEDHARATALLKESLALYRKEKDSTGIAICVGLLGWAALLRGDYRGATGLLEQAIAELQGVGLEVEVYFPITLGLAEMLKGELQQAKENIGKGLILSRKLSDRIGAVWGLEGMAMIATSQRKLERAAKLWGSAEALREAIGAPLRPDERSLYAPFMSAARVELDGGAWEEGRKMNLEEVLEYAFSERDRDPPASLTQQPLRGGQRSTVLTPREGEIADLVARGLTNRQVASELSISEHTVATHVARILKKLRLNSRSQLSAWVSERGFPSSGFD